MQETGLTAFEGSGLHFSKTGSGNKTLLAFHGFGQKNSHFEDIIKVLHETYTIYSFDLYFHGKSNWVHGEKVLTKKEWCATLNIFLKENNITSCSVMGYSLGGKFALATLEAHPELIDSLIFLAPDGIKTSFWYSLATYPSLFRKYFKRTIERPNSFFLLLKLLHFFRLVHKGVIRFAKSQMDTQEKRHRVYHSWVVFRKLKFKQPEILKTIKSQNISTYLILGKHDRIITYRNLKNFIKRLGSAKVFLIDAGHNDLIQKSAPYLQRELANLPPGYA